MREGDGERGIHTGNGDLKLPLLTDDMIIYIEKLKESLSGFSKVRE